MAGQNATKNKIMLGDALKTEESILSGDKVQFWTQILTLKLCMNPVSITVL